MTTRGSIKRTILTAAMLLALPVGVAAQSAPDLVVPGPNVSKTSVETGETFWFIATVTNDGDAQSQSAATTVRYLRSTDATITASDKEEGTDAVRALLVNQGYAATIRLTAPSKADTYYYGACVDEVPGESDTTNNCSGAVSVTVSAGGGGGGGGPVVSVPGAVGNLMAVAGDGEVVLSWDAPSSDGGAEGAVTGYEVEWSPDGETGWTGVDPAHGGTETGYGDTGLDGGTTRHYRVRAVNDAGPGEWSAVVSATTVPDAPENVSATASGTSRIDVSWTAPEGEVTGYEVEWSADGETGWTGVDPAHGGTGTEYGDTGLDGGTTRHYRVRAVNDAGTGEWSAVVSATTVPDAPENVSATASGASRIDVSWTAPEGEVTGYEVEWSADGETGWTGVDPAHGGTGTEYGDTGLDGGTTRHYRVRAVNDAATGEWSAVVSATTVPDAPENVSATASGASRIDVSWTAPEGEVTGYEVEWSADGETGWTGVDPAHGGTGTEYGDTGLDGGTTRHYRVRAVNDAGTGEWSAVVSATTSPPLRIDPGDRAVRVGETAFYTITLEPGAASPGAVLRLACEELPPNASCAFSPASLVAGDAPVTSALTVTTASRLAEVLFAPEAPGGRGPAGSVWLMLAAMAALGLVLAARESQPRRRRVRVPALLIFVVLSMQSGCGGDMTGPAPEQPTVAPGTYTFTVVARSDADEVSAVATLTVR